MIQAPIFHVNGDDPEAAVWVARLAVEYRQTFGRDVVIDMVCYRRRGHNEGDDPSMTNPLMYQIIDGKRSVRRIYTEALIGRGDLSPEDAEEALRDYHTQLERVFNEVRDLEKAVATPVPVGGGRAADPARGGDQDQRGRCCTGSPTPPWTSRRASPRTPGSSRCWSAGWRCPARAASTGRSANCSRSARSRWRAGWSGCPARTPGAAPSCSATPC